MSYLAKLIGSNDLLDETDGKERKKLIQQGFHLQFQNINASVVTKKKEKKQILFNVSGECKPGEILAILGPSGAGKTSLMNILSGRSQCSYTGELLVDGKVPNKSIRRKFCYVMQQDLFFEALTLRETLTFTATIRLSDSMSQREKLKKVDEIVEVLGLTNCIDTVMGGVSMRGLSGGEKKRASIACELLNNPKLMLLDEPTTGLDSGAATDLFAALEEYSSTKSLPIITTIHQPSSHIFSKFHNIMLLVDGRLGYFGDRVHVVPYFEKIGLPCSANYNPADHLLEQAKDADAKKVLLEAYENRNILQTQDAETGEETEMKKSSSTLVEDDEKRNNRSNELDLKWPTGFVTQFLALGKRNFKSARGQLLSNIHLTFTFLVAAIASIFWFRIPRTEERLADRTGAIFFIAIHTQFNAVFQSITSYPTECKIINRERSSGAYRLSAFMMAKYISEIPLHLIKPVGQLILMYWVMNLMPSAGNFFMWIALTILTTISAQGIAIFLGTLFTDFKTLLASTAIVMLTNMLAGGWFVRQLPKAIVWLRYLSLMGYGFGGLFIVEYKYGDPLKCAPSNETAFNVCKTNSTNTISGDDIVEKQGDIMPLWLNIVAPIGYILLFRILAYLNLRFINKPNK
ncbi:DgyrCDS9580 [Dimorphilus gyrociliatus]|uniref:DgyrCDS9580 n=1 Tax=Dimorphilus gyrociliatus TaxID=2664684 RepID=A0A7I8VXE6_9ANNE|nr:DgyrCDS9580 [Dimorphilus gyrociliatus]